MRKRKIYLWLELFIAVSILILLLMVASYFFLQNIIKKQIGVFISEDIEKEKEQFLESIKLILGDDQKSLYDTEKNRFDTLKKIQELLKENKYIVACNIFLNRNLVFSYNKINFDLIPMSPPPPKSDENMPPMGRYWMTNRFKPPKLKPGFFMEQYIFRTQPLKVFIVNIIFYHEKAKNFLERLKVLFILFYLLLLLISFPIVLLIAKQFSKPIRDLVKKTFLLSSGNYDVKIENRRNDEISLLIDAFNNLSYELKKDQEFRKKITSQITHDISTPINIIKSYIYGIKDGIINPNTDTILAIDSEIERINELVDQINLFSNKENINIENLPSLSISGEIDIYIEKILYLFNKEKIDLKKDIEDNIFYPIRRNHFRSVTENIIKNSLQHNDNDIKKIEITLYSKEKAINFSENLKNELIKKGYSYYSINKVKKEGKKLLFSFIVSDNGLGINKEELPNIFNRYYKARNGKKNKEKWSNGVGLSIVEEICNLYSIELEIYSLVNKGTIIFLNFYQ